MSFQFKEYYFMQFYPLQNKYINIKILLNQLRICASVISLLSEIKHNSSILLVQFIPSSLHYVLCNHMHSLNLNL